MEHQNTETFRIIHASLSESDKEMDRPLNRMLKPRVRGPFPGTGLTNLDNIFKTHGVNAKSCFIYYILSNNKRVYQSLTNIYPTIWVDTESVLARFAKSKLDWVNHAN